MEPNAFFTPPDWPLSDLGPEWQSLEMLVRGITTDAERELILNVCRRDDFNWDEFVQQANRHNILVLAAYYVVVLLRIETPLYIAQLFRHALNRNRRQLAILRNEASQVNREFKRRKIRFVATKGIANESCIYEAGDIRQLGDIDFMIGPNDAVIAAEALNSLGYELKDYRGEAIGLVPYSRPHLIRYALNPDHLPHFRKETHNNALPVATVDIAMSLTWARSKYNISMDHALEFTECFVLPGVQDGVLPKFLPEFDFIFTVLHLYREAWFGMIFEVESVKTGDDVTLHKFADILRIWNRHNETLLRGYLIEIIAKYELQHPIAWVLDHLDRTFATNITAALDLEGTVLEEDLFHTYDQYGKLCRWRGSMRTRLNCKDRRMIYAEI